ncbi:MAG TPA: hypothetical protein VGD14_21050 [bacterium]
MHDQRKIKDQERFQHLLMGALDDELTAEETREFNALVKKYPEFQTERKKYQHLKEVTQTMKFKSPKKEVWDNYWINVYNRIERGIAWIIFSIGSVILITYGLFKAVEAIIADPQLESIIKIGIIAVLAGAVILLVSVIREKLFVRSSDPYKEIQR